MEFLATRVRWAPKVNPIPQENELTFPCRFAASGNHYGHFY